MTWAEREEQTYKDKSSWVRGEWDDEPDRIEWRHNGTPCLIVRNNSGALCGYAAVSEGHPMFAKSDEGCQLDCHGGVTYEDFCVEGGKICHVPKPGEPGRVWWFGFDCAHSGDYSGMSYPEGIRLRHPEGFERYRSVGYVRNQVESMAEQLVRIGQGLPARDE